MSAMPKTVPCPNVVALVRQLCNTLTAAAQPVATGDNIRFRWGQHVFDDTGDNIGQFGLHGTCQAVLALSKAKELLSPSNHYGKFIEGGRDWLIDRVESPKKSLDVRKTLKVAEHLRALRASKAAPEHCAQLSSLLLASTGGPVPLWTFDVQVSAAQEAIEHILPSTYAVHALLESHDEEFRDKTRASILSCFSTLAHTGDIDPMKSAALAYAVSGNVEHFDAVFGADTELLQAVSDTTRALGDRVFSVNEMVTFEYRMQENGEETHAFCNVPLGLMQLSTDLFASIADLDFVRGHEDLQRNIRAFLATVNSSRLSLQKLLTTCSQACRLLVASSRQIETVAQGHPYSIPLPSHQGAETETPQSDPREEPDVRKQTYMEMLAEQASDLTILKPLTGGFSGAWLDLCQIRDSETSAVLRPEVIKLDTSNAIEQELKGAETAKKYLPASNRIDIRGRAKQEDADKALIRYEYASDTLAPQHVRLLLDHVRAESDTNHLADITRRVFDDGLGQLLDNQTPDSRSIETLLAYFDSIRRDSFLSQVKRGIAEMVASGDISYVGDREDRIQLNFPRVIVENMLADTARTREAFQDFFPLPTIPAAHNDLNPRNVLICSANDGHQPIIIDYHRFGGPAPITVDFARLEVGLQVKGLVREINNAVTESEGERNLILYERAINGTLLHDAALTDPSFRNISGDVKKIGQIVGAIRCSLARHASCLESDSRGYYATLALSYLGYLRTAYKKRLSSAQRTFALYSASMIFDRFL